PGTGQPLAGLASGGNRPPAAATAPGTRVETAAGAPTNKAAPAKPASSMQRAEAILEQLKVRIQGGDREATINLNPVDLGRLRLHVKVDQGAVHASIAAESAETLAVLEAHAPELRAWLSRDGAESVELNLGLMTSAEADAQSRSEQGERGQHSGSRRDQGSGGGISLASPEALHRTWMPAARHLDLYADMDLPVPATLFDEHADNSSAAARSEMTIAEHMYLFYDLFVPPVEGADPKKGGSLDASGQRNLDRMTPAQRALWDAAYGPRNAAFRAADLEGEDLVRWKYQRYVKNYLRCVRGVDESVGRLVDWLAENGLDENTIVIYSSDQGFYLGDHGWYDKRWMYEESLEMPFVIRWPGVVPAGGTSDALIQNLDYAPTFLEAAGAEIPADMQGRSLLPVLGGETPEDWRDAIYYRYFEFPGPHQVAKHYGIRTDRYKLMYFHDIDQWEFYDLQEDPDELTNVFGAPEHTARIARLATRLGEMKAEALDVD
ncbi:DUF4976 domain-containing protein, partial [bacterium]|nr:DUF4976 domain-containing protein [bacterium]